MATLYRMLVPLAVLLRRAPARRYDKCELAEELASVHGLAPREVHEWVCIAEFESTFNTAAVNKINWDGSFDYGLFQLNSRYWCRDHFGGKDACRMPCTDLLDDDISDDLKCVALILEDTERWKGPGTGLSAWVAYVKRCEGRNLTAYMMDCPSSPDDIAANLIPRDDEKKVEQQIAISTVQTLVEAPKESGQTSEQSGNLILPDAMKNEEVKTSTETSRHPSQDFLHVRDLTGAYDEETPAAETGTSGKTFYGLFPAYYHGILIAKPQHVAPGVSLSSPLLHNHLPPAEPMLKKTVLGSQASGLHLSVYEKL